jgi:hypothetical protein
MRILENSDETSFLVELDSGRLLRDEDLLIVISSNFKSTVLKFKTREEAQEALAKYKQRLWMASELIERMKKND